MYDLWRVYEILLLQEHAMFFASTLGLSKSQEGPRVPRRYACPVLSSYIALCVGLAVQVEPSYKHMCVFVCLVAAPIC